MRDIPFAVRRKKALFSAAVAIAGAALVPGSRAGDHNGSRAELNRLPPFVVASSV
jgi:hydroxybutyrate-dimer hydrolase